MDRTPNLPVRGGRYTYFCDPGYLLVLSNEWVTVKKHTQADIRHAVVFTCE